MYSGDANYQSNATATVDLAVKASKPKPTLTSVSPATGPAGTTVTLHGADLAGATNVLFGTLAAKSFTCTSATRCTAVAPSGGTGQVDLLVKTATGTSEANADATFTYIAHVT
jgi:hypothetical protein